MTNRFYDHWQPPMPGGWHLPVNGEIIREHSPEELFNTIKRLRGNNGTFGTDEELETELWQYWCSLNPQRCGAEVPAGTGRAESRNISKAEWGRSLWLHVNFAAVNFRREYFLALVSEMASGTLIECPNCRENFARQIEKLPTWSLDSQADACRWAFDIHNAVNAEIGKPIYTWAQAMAEFGFPTET